MLSHSVRAPSVSTDETTATDPAPTSPQVTPSWTRCETLRVPHPRHQPPSAEGKSSPPRAALAFRLVWQSGFLYGGSLGSPGVDELRWLKPVRPGDTLRLRSTVIESTPSGKQPNRGTVLFRWEILNQNGEVALSMLGRQLFLRRAPA